MLKFTCYEKKKKYGKAFHLQYRQSVRGNAYGRQEEVYPREDCRGCPYTEQRKMTDQKFLVRSHFLQPLYKFFDCNII